MKIAIINQPWGGLVPPKPSGSIPILIYETAQRLAKAGHDVTVYNRALWKKEMIQHEGVTYKSIPIVLDKVLIKGLNRLPFRNDLKPPFLWNIAYFTYGLQIALDLRGKSCDWVHVHNFSQFISTICFFNPKVKVALQTHCEWLNKLDAKFLEPRLQKADIIVSCSSFLTQETQQRFPNIADRCHTIFNGVDAEYFSQLSYTESLREDHAANQKYSEDSKRLLHPSPSDVAVQPTLHQTSVSTDLADTLAARAMVKVTPCLLAAHRSAATPSLKPLRILYVGRLSPEKGTHILLEAFERVYEKMPTVQLDLVGSQEVMPYEYLIGMDDDPKILNLLRFYPSTQWQAYLMQWQRSHPAAKQVNFVGNVNYADLKHYYHSADLFVFPSICDEAFGMPVAEAMVAGLPVITTHAGALPELVDYGRCGWLVPPDDATSLAAKMLEVLASLKHQPSHHPHWNANV
ncbi:MAG: glycosyltransferase family 4 protein, partial [Synechococcales bacterium]|nr:glycosyltransferase family 4 protein [Synechococcales bacterium]